MSEEAVVTEKTDAAGSYVVFVGSRRVAAGALVDVVLAAKRAHDRGTKQRIALYDTGDGRPFDVDFSGSEGEVLGRLAQHPVHGLAGAKPRRGPGRPKLGVVSREVSLLPRHWTWLAEQPAGASAAIRRLVDAARKETAGSAAVRQAIDAAHRFMWDIAGNQPGFEEASRALFAKDFDEFEGRTARWPAGVRAQLANFIEAARRAEATSSRGRSKSGQDK